MSADPRLHRSYLYAPGANPRVMGKALEAGADAVVLDLEDSVDPTEKSAARRQVAEVLGGAGGAAPCAVHVRINRFGAGYDTDDVRAVVQPGLSALRLPKVEDPAAVGELDELLAGLESAAGMAAGTVGLYPTVESAVGALRSGEVLAASPRMRRAAFGASDFLADIGAVGDEDLGTQHARSHLVLVSRAAGAGPPIDSVHTDLDDEDGLRRAAIRARALGFIGKSVIHPRQLPAVHAVFTPAPEELAQAQRVIDALASADGVPVGAVALDGAFIDAAVVARARAVLTLKEAIDGSA